MALVATGSAQQPTVNLPIGKTSPNNGKQMFVGYCAPCHGVDGKGNGPVTSSLLQKPTDLTTLSRNNGGKFPQAHVVAIINFGSNVAGAHGTKDMPI
jgi:mono/diheme cytochrome c family protein